MCLCLCQYECMLFEMSVIFYLFTFFVSYRSCVQNIQQIYNLYFERGRRGKGAIIWNMMRNKYLSIVPSFPLHKNWTNCLCCLPITFNARKWCVLTSKGLPQAENTLFGCFPNSRPTPENGIPIFWRNFYFTIFCQTASKLLKKILPVEGLYFTGYHTKAACIHIHNVHNPPQIFRFQSAQCMELIFI